MLVSYCYTFYAHWNINSHSDHKNQLAFIFYRHHNPNKRLSRYSAFQDVFLGELTSATKNLSQDNWIPRPRFEPGVFTIHVSNVTTVPHCLVTQDEIRGPVDGEAGCICNLIKVTPHSCDTSLGRTCSSLGNDQEMKTWSFLGPRPCRAIRPPFPKHYKVYSAQGYDIQSKLWQ
jgi:hypothetical protein